MVSAKGHGERPVSEDDQRLRKLWPQRLWAEETGQDLVEYTLLLAFIGLVGAALFIGMGSTTSDIWAIVNSRVSNANQAS